MKGCTLLRQRTSQDQQGSQPQVDTEGHRRTETDRRGQRQSRRCLLTQRCAIVGRFDESLRVEAPASHVREALLRQCLQGTPSAPEVDFARVRGIVFCLFHSCYSLLSSGVPLLVFFLCTRLCDEFLPCLRSALFYSGYLFGMALTAARSAPRAEIMAVQADPWEHSPVLPIPVCLRFGAPQRLQGSLSHSSLLLLPASPSNLPSPSFSRADCWGANGINEDAAVNTRAHSAARWTRDKCCATLFVWRRGGSGSKGQRHGREGRGG